MPVVSEEDIRIEKLEAKMKGVSAPQRCPLCWDESHVESQEHSYGESTVIEFLHIDCETCGIIVECRTCYLYILVHPENHPCPDKLLTKKLCTCPPLEESTSSTDLDLLGAPFTPTPTSTGISSTAAASLLRGRRRSR